MTRARDPLTTLAIIRDGIPDRVMPGFRHFTEAELRALANYVLSLGRTETVAVKGDAEKGKAVYQNLGLCFVPHHPPE
jgi:mono/diheme cytochrome c family protein